MAKQPELTPAQTAELKKKLESMSPEEIQELVKQQCIFCKIIAGEIQSFTIYEDKKVLAFLDIQPATTGHVVVIPKKHYSILAQMPDNEVGYLFSVAKQLASVVFDSLGAQGTTILQNSGAAAGQMVPHVRIDIIPRFPEDKLKFEWKPQKLEEKQFGAIQQTLSAAAKSIKVKESSASKTAPATKTKTTTKKRAPREFRAPSKKAHVRIVKA
jgi:histidine triad (HIT) family protein